LANPRVAPDWAVAHLSPAAIHAHVSAHFYPGERLTIVGLGVEHTTLVKALTPVFSKPELKGSFFELERASAVKLESLPSAPAWAPRPILLRQSAEAGAHVVLAFKGAARTSARERLALLAFKAVLGSSTPELGSVQNRAARLSRHILEPHHAVTRAEAFHCCYADAGVFGVYAAAQEGFGPQLVPLLHGEVVRSARELAPEDVVRAKNTLKADRARKHVNRKALADSLFAAQSAQSLQTANEYNAAVDALTLEEIRRVAQAAISTPVIVAAQGDVRGIRLPSA